MEVTTMEPRDTGGNALEVGEVKIRLVDEGDDGLVGWVSCVVNGALYLNNIAIRHGRNGEFVLTYPCKRSRSEQKYFYFNPITREAKRVIDEAILGRFTRGEAA
jgi:DNA-binding cell septation regulator SpoVG